MTAITSLMKTVQQNLLGSITTKNDNVKINNMNRECKETIVTNKKAFQVELQNNVDKLNAQQPENNNSIIGSRRVSRGCRPTNDPATKLIDNDYQLLRIWQLYTWSMPYDKAGLTPSEFLRAIESVTPEQLHSAEQRMTSDQIAVLKEHYALQPEASSLHGKSVDREIDLINRMFAAGLIEHNPVLDINLSKGYWRAKYDTEDNAKVWDRKQKSWVSLSDYPKTIQLAEHRIDPEELIKNQIKTKMELEQELMEEIYNESRENTQKKTKESKFI